MTYGQLPGDDSQDVTPEEREKWALDEEAQQQWLDDLEEAGNA